MPSTDNKLPIDLLRDGILTQDWDMVTEGYIQMFGNLPSPPKSKKSAQKTAKSGKVGRPPKAKPLLVQRAPAKSSKKNLDEESDDSVDNVIEIAAQKSSSKSGPVKLNSKPYFPYAQAHDKAAEKINKHLKKIAPEKDRREAYKPLIRNCGKCGKKFDVRKDSPGGKLDSDIELRCHKCQLQTVD